MPGYKYVYYVYTSDLHLLLTQNIYYLIMFVAAITEQIMISGSNRIT